MTPIRLMLLDFISSYEAENRCAPTYQEIADGTGLKSVASVHFHLNKLAKSGHAILNGHARRGLQLTDAGRKIARPKVGAA